MLKLKNKTLASWLISLVILSGIGNVLGDSNKFELTLGGGGNSGTAFDNTAVGLNLGLGVNVTRHLELGVRQDVLFSDVGTSAFRGATSLAADWNLFSSWLTPFVGVVGTFSYGGVNAFGFGPEAGLKLKLTKDTFVFVAGEYKFKVDTFSGPPLKDGVVYRAGIGLKF